MTFSLPRQAGTHVHLQPVHPSSTGGYLVVLPRLATLSHTYAAAGPKRGGASMPPRHERLAKRRISGLMGHADGQKSLKRPIKTQIKCKFYGFWRVFWAFRRPPERNIMCRGSFHASPLVPSLLEIFWWLGCDGDAWA